MTTLNVFVHDFEKNDMDVMSGGFDYKSNIQFGIQ